MASPFSSFRKHQKKMLAFLGVLCMVVFVVGSSAVSCAGGRGGGGGMTNGVVVTTKYDTYREADVDQLVRNEKVVNSFISYARQAAGLGSQAPPPPTEENAVQTKILADMATSMGIVVSDESINRFMFQDVAGNKLSTSAMKGLLRKYDINEVVLFNALRTELLAGQLRQMMFPDLFRSGAGQNVTPAERWEYYLRVNRQSHVEVLPISVEAFADGVADPGEDVLREFFVEHKERLPDPQTPEPGFRRPQLASFQAVFADFNAFFEEEKAKVTAEQIEEHYNKNRETYRYSGFDEPEDDDAPVSAPDPELDEPAAEDPENPDADDPEGGDPCQADEGDDDGDAAKQADGAEKQADDAGKQADGAAQPGDQAKQPGDAGDDGAGDDGETEPEEPSVPLATLRAELLQVPQDIKAGADPTYDPLWKVEESIRETLAREAAEERIDEAIGKIRTQMGTYYTTWSEWEVVGSGAEPEKPDLQQLAAGPACSCSRRPKCSRNVKPWKRTWARRPSTWV